MLPTDYQEYIHKSRYARYLDDKGRRETWEETVDRYVDNVIRPHVTEPLTVEVLRNSIADLEVMPSMRGLMTAGPALERDNAAIFNCAYLPVDHPRAFDEAMYILLCGTGVGFSVERQYIAKLPEVAEEFHDSGTVINVRDSKIGWATSLKELLSLLYDGQVPKWDVSKIRPHGARLKTFGGRASGPEPLVKLFQFVVNTFRNAAGRKLTSLECHDIMCKIGEAVVVGGVRRSAMISLSNLSDDRMRRAKSGQWYVEDPQRGLANNSVCFTEKPDFPSFLKEWNSLYESKSGERGFFNRVAAQKQAAKNGRRDPNHEFGTNPCSEIILRPYQFCNLTEVVVRKEDSLEDLRRKVRIAAMLGTVQAKYTNFRYLRPIWRKNTEEEALLGVSMTGVMDHPVLSKTGPETAEWLDVLKDEAILANVEWAGKLGVNVSTAITCVKPSGTVSQLTDTASGLHPRYSSHYIRRVRNDAKDPLSGFLKAQGVPWEEALGNPSTLVFSFPHKAPEGAVCRNDRTAIQQLEHWLMIQEHWCEHKPSITVYYRDNEFLALGQWVWEHFDKLSGVAFLPHSDHLYMQAPYEEIDAVDYAAMQFTIPPIRWEDFVETEDNTTGTQTFACVGDKCEIS
jgi:ribonucleoside-triphosphate reductase